MDSIWEVQQKNKIDWLWRSIKMWIKKGLIFNKHRAQLPIVDEYEDFYRIYYSTRFEGKSKPLSIDVDINNPNKIIRENAIPILELGNPGSFDWAGIMPTDIIDVDGVKYMYYIGWSLRIDIPYHNNLGLALSLDNGHTWQKYSNGPIFSTNSIETGYIGTVEILREDGIWKMWYLSCRDWIEIDGIMEPTYDIRYAWSYDGKEWKPTNIVCIGLDGNEGGISSCRVIKDDVGYTMWYSIRDKFDYRRNKNHSYRIKKATSKDGINWDKNNNVELDIDENVDWENIMVCYPFVLKRKNELIMFYNGNDFGNSGVGYAIKK